MRLQCDRPHDSPTPVSGPAIAFRRRGESGTRFIARPFRSPRWNPDAPSFGWAAVQSDFPKRSGEGAAKSPLSGNASRATDEWCGSPRLAETRRGSWGLSGDRLEPIGVAVASVKSDPAGAGWCGHERVVAVR